MTRDLRRYLTERKIARRIRLFFTYWRWGKDIDWAEEVARKKNADMGISEEEANKIMLSTMFKGAIEKPRL